jgi:hypothetical protein
LKTQAVPGEGAKAQQKLAVARQKRINETVRMRRTGRLVFFILAIGLLLLVASLLFFYPGLIGKVFAETISADTSTTGTTLYMPIIYTPPPFITQRLDSTVYYNNQKILSPTLFTDLGSRSIALRSDNSPCIAYGANHLYIQCLNSSGWSGQTVVDSAFGVGRYASLAIWTGDNQPRIAYYDETNGALKYAVDTSSGWQISTVDQPASLSSASAADESGLLSPEAVTIQASGKGGVGGWPSLALGSDGFPHIAYYDYDHGQLKYASLNGSVWDTSAVGPADGSGKYPSLALFNGLPRVAYSSGGNQLLYAVFNGSGWVVSPIDSGKPYAYASLVVDGNDKAYVAYESIDSSSTSSLRYAESTAGTGAFSTPATVYATGQAGAFASLALKSGQPAIAFYTFYPSGSSCDVTRPDCSGNGSLLLATRSNGSWTISTGPGGDNFGQYSSLAIDQNGKVYISYYHASKGQLSYVERSNTGAWGGVTALDDNYFTDGATSLQLTSSGSPALCYRDDVHDNLYFATLNSNTWQNSFLDGPPVSSSDIDSGIDCSLVFDPGGHASITYWMNRQLWLLHASDHGWGYLPDRNTPIDNGSPASSYNVGLNSSQVFDANGWWRISYNDAGNHVLKYTYFNGNNFPVVSNPAQDGEGNYTSITVNRAGDSIISYHNVLDNTLRVVWLTGDGGFIRRDLVDSNKGTGIYSSIALDPSGNPNVSYLDSASGKLKFAHYNGSSWSVSVVDDFGQPGDEYGASTSLRYDAQGRAHIAYFDPIHDDLKYAVLTGTTWKIITVDSAGDVGRRASMALDAQGKAHISYFDTTNGDIKYAVEN